MNLFLHGIKANKIQYNELRLLFEYEDNFRLVFDIYKKRKKLPLELEVLSFYLKSLANFISLIHYYEPISQLNTILNTFNRYLKVNSYTKNHILFKYGDFSTKYYILLKGRAYTLVPRKLKTSMTFDKSRNTINK